MNTLKSNWITTKDFLNKSTINIFHKEHEKIEENNHPKKLQNKHIYFRKKFNIKKIENKYILDITADDYYKLYINGKFLAQGPAPSYHFHYWYNRYNITEYIQEGENVIFVHVYYQGLVNRVWNSGDLRMGMACLLKNNNETIIFSDSSWKYKISDLYNSGGKVGYDTQFLENIDLRKKEVDIKDIIYDDTKWENAYIKNKNDYKFYLQESKGVSVYYLKPKTITKKKNKWFIDFGQEITGQIDFEISGNSGEKVIVKHAEELESSNELKWNMRCNCKYLETLILSGKENERPEYYDYKAFRYVSIETKKAVINENSIRAIVRHYPMNKKACQFSSSSKLLSQIWCICKNAVKYGTQEAYLDCPSREKGQYLGDASVTTLSHMYLSGDTKLYKKMLRDFSMTSFISKGLMAVAPGSLMQEIADYSLQWPTQLLKYYYHTGDLKFLREMYPTCEKIYEYFKCYENKDGLLEKVEEKWNLVDWPENLRDDYDFDLKNPIGEGVHNVINAFYCGMIKTIYQIRDILDIEYINNYHKYKEAYIDYFYRKSDKLFVDSKDSNHNSLHSNALALYFNLEPEEAKDSIADFIENKGFNCGVYMAFFVLKALVNVNRYDSAYKLMTNKSKQSYANMIREGATTCFEAWGKEQKWNTSLCHPWASAPIIIIIEDILGIRPQNAGWGEVSINPNIPKELKEVCFEMVFKNWKIKIKKLENKEIQFESIKQ